MRGHPQQRSFPSDSGRGMDQGSSASPVAGLKRRHCFAAKTYRQSEATAQLKPVARQRWVVGTPFSDAFSSFHVRTARYWNADASSGKQFKNLLSPRVVISEGVWLFSTPADDDDISQHEAMAEPKSDNDSASKKNGGYRRIEDWHEETVAKNPKQVLTRLQQEKAMWDKKFEDLGGDGI